MTASWVPLDEAARRVGPGYSLQGNLDPAVLLADRETVDREVTRIVQQGRAGRGHVFNLGHGVLPDTDPAHAAALAERVRVAVEGMATSPRVTASIGVAGFPAHGADERAVVAAADMALYRAKAGGRNRVECAPLPAWPVVPAQPGPADDAAVGVGPRSGAPATGRGRAARWTARPSGWCRRRHPRPPGPAVPCAGFHLPRRSR